VGTSKDCDLLDQPRQKAHSWNCAGLGAWAIVAARQQHNVGVKLPHTLHKLTNADVLWLLEHIRDVVLLLISRIIGEHG
jgi:hypothetical protein